MYVRKNIGANGKTYLSMVHGYRDNEGRVKQKIVENLGYVDDLMKIYDDPITHFRKIAKQRTAEYCENRKIEFEISKNSKLVSNVNYRKNMGYSILKKVYSELKIGDFFQSKQRKIDVEYNLNSIFSLLVFNRILFPSSKKKAFERKDRFFERFNFSLEDIYRSLTFFNRYSVELQQHLNEQVINNYGRDNTLGYYDVTNYYFEIPYEDEDTVDENGNVIIKGHRKKGPSKENRRDPIRQMGLLMDTSMINFSGIKHHYSNSNSLNACNSS